MGRLELLRAFPLPPRRRSQKTNTRREEMAAMGVCAEIAHKLVTFPQGKSTSFVNVIKLGTFCRTVVWPCLPPLMMYQYIRQKDADLYATEVFYFKTGCKEPKAFNDSSRVGLSGHWRLQQDMETIRSVANQE